MELEALFPGRRNAEDSDLWLRLGTSPGFVRIDSPQVFIHRLTPGSEVSIDSQAFRGLRDLLSTEKMGGYPGGNMMKLDRLRIISRHIRPGGLALLNAGYLKEAIWLYCNSIFIHLRLARIKFLIGFPLLLLKTLLLRGTK